MSSIDQNDPANTDRMVRTDLTPASASPPVSNALLFATGAMAIGAMILMLSLLVTKVIGFAISVPR